MNSAMRMRKTRHIICKSCGYEFIHAFRITCSYECAEKLRREATIKALTGKPRPAGVIERVRQKNLGLKRSPEVIEKNRQAGLRSVENGTFKLRDAEVIAKAKQMRMLSGFKRSPEQNLKHSLILKGRKMPLEDVISRSVANRKPQTKDCTKKGITNQLCKWWHFRSPTGKTYLFKNVRVFTEEHSELFDPKDLVEQYKNLKRPVLGVVRIKAPSNAVKRLCELGARRLSTWKGWTLVSEEEKFHNEGKDLLHREPLEIDQTDTNQPTTQELKQT